MIMISSCFSINTWLNYNPLKYYFIYLHWPLHGTPLIARVAVLTVDVQHEGVLYCTVLYCTVLYCTVLYYSVCTVDSGQLARKTIVVRPCINA